MKKSDAATADIEDSDEGKTKRRRRRGRRGGRRRRRNEDGEATASEENSDEKVPMQLHQTQRKHRT
ncbi:MAG: hypothetical protein CM15mP21_4540 [Hyphomicrobiales bacterium]|nr:MAG: hypothetical protein CM15mP21_4540 [Hyphomicrobiales bacterium]